MAWRANFPRQTTTRIKNESSVVLHSVGGVQTGALIAFAGSVAPAAAIILPTPVHAMWSLTSSTMYTCTHEGYFLFSINLNTRNTSNETVEAQFNNVTEHTIFVACGTASNYLTTNLTFVKYAVPGTTFRLYTSTGVTSSIQDGGHIVITSI